METIYWLEGIYRNGRVNRGGGYNDRSTAEGRARDWIRDADYLCRVEVIERPDVANGTLIPVDAIGRHVNETGRVVSTYFPPTGVTPQQLFRIVREQQRRGLR